MNVNPRSLRYALPMGRPSLILKASALAVICVGLWTITGCSGDRQAQLDEIRSMQQAGQFDPSISPLRQLLADAPDNAEANYMLGLALRQTGRPSLAVWPLHKAAED